MSEKKVWFITGSSTGLGRVLAEELLEQGYRVVATARNVGTVQDLTEKFGDSQVVAAALDVTDPETIKSAVEKAFATFGQIDVLVNNAGYGLGGGVEEPSEEQIFRQFDTNFFGAARLMRAVLPKMREQKSGHIINVSSIGGFRAVPSGGYYCATKFALEGLSESLRQELSHLGIKVTIVEPGSFRTDFAGRSFNMPENQIEDYVTSQIGLKRLKDYSGTQMGDPRKGAKVIISAAESENPPLRLPLGADAVNGIESELESIKNDIAPWREAAINTAFDDEANAQSWSR